ncbi:TetR/AcrR family transcriptional regulator [Puniceicoccaceae bacterium K14]|nr:TetR/AcrR family transcriptional regulator [Puniceicoccaceae bacterium K14]
MRISQEKKEETRRKLIDTAVEMIMEEGYQKATMKKIAKAAGVGPATIYKYFPSKEKLLVGFYVQKARYAIEDLEAVDDFAEFSLKEKVQALLEGYLEHLLVDREFAMKSLEMILNSASLVYSDTAPIKKEFKQVITRFLDEAEGKGEIAEMPFRDLVPEMLCHFVVGVLIYWSKDESEEFADTTRMIDLSLELGYEVLSSGIINKSFDLGSFFLKSYFFRSMGSKGNLLQKLVKAKTAFIAG